jgi:hypothetical protein
VGESIGEVPIDGVECVAEFGWCLGLIGGEQWGQDPIVDFGVEDREA